MCWGWQISAWCLVGWFLLELQTIVDPLSRNIVSRNLGPKVSFWLEAKTQNLGMLVIRVLDCFQGGECDMSLVIGDILPLLCGV